jgi:hypothetical protein
MVPQSLPCWMQVRQVDAPVPALAPDPVPALAARPPAAAPEPEVAPAPTAPDPLLPEPGLLFSVDVLDEQAANTIPTAAREAARICCIIFIPSDDLGLRDAGQTSPSAGAIDQTNYSRR